MTTAAISSTGTSTSRRIRPTEEPFFAVLSGASPFWFFCTSSGPAAFSPAPCLSPLPPDFSPLPFLSAVSVPAAPGEAEASAVDEALGEAAGDALGDTAGEALGAVVGAAVVPGASLGIGLVRLMPHILQIHSVTPSCSVVGCTMTVPAFQL